MITIPEIKGITRYLEKLTHPVRLFNFNFKNIIYEFAYVGKVILSYDLYITSKKPNSPWMWDYFHCKSKHIVEDACDMVGANFGDILINVKVIYVDGIESPRFGGEITDSFSNYVTSEVIKNSPKVLERFFFCNNERKIVKFYVEYDVSDIYIEDGVVLDISVDCYQMTIDGEEVLNLTEDIVNVITGYMNDSSDDFRIPGDNIIWEEITKYMELENCDLYGHTYANMRNIGDIWADYWDYTGHLIFSSKMCDFYNGDD